MTVVFIACTIGTMLLVRVVQLTNTSILILAGLIVVIIIPIVVIIERERINLYSSFMTVPMSIIKRLAKISQTRLRMLQAALDQIEDGGAEDHDDLTEVSASQSRAAYFRISMSLMYPLLSTCSAHIDACVLVS